jgi:hypothetical protein
MDIKQLHAMGALVTRSLTRKEITVRHPALRPKSEWADATQPEFSDELVVDTMTCWVRKRSSADFLEMMQAPDRDKAHVAVLRCICHEDGREVFESLDQAKQLQEWLFIPLMVAVNEVNQFGLKNSQPRTSSGARSLSASADGQSLNGSRRSPKKNARRGSRIAPSAAP